MGLEFPAPIAMAAGFDRTGKLAGLAHRIGLGALELGSVAAGSEELRRVAASIASQGRGRRSNARHAICGVSLIKRPRTPWDCAEVDFVTALRELGGRADYVTLNAGKDRPAPERFAQIVRAVAQARDALAASEQRRVPLVAKLPVDWLVGARGGEVAASFVANGADGLLIAAEHDQAAQCDEALRRISAGLGGSTCLISVGGVDSVREALRRLRAGARLVQLHGALRHSNGRQLIRRIERAIDSL